MDDHKSQTSYIATRALDQHDHFEPLPNPHHNDIEVDFEE
jgi:hypothetical protein